MRRGWIIAFVVVVTVSCAVAALALTAGSAMIAESNAYFSRFDFSAEEPIEVDQAEFDRYNMLAVRGSAIAAIAGPLFLAVLGGIAGLLAVLSVRYDRTHGRRVQTAAVSES